MKTLITIICLFVGINMQAQNVIQYTFDKKGQLITEHFESVYKLDFSFDVEGNIQSKYLTNYSSLKISHSKEKDNDIIIYPNPANGFFVVECKQTGLDGEICIFDISGRVIAKTLFRNSRANIDARNYKSGTYFIELKTLNEGYIKKLVVE